MGEKKKGFGLLSDLAAKIPVPWDESTPKRPRVPWDEAEARKNPTPWNEGKKRP